VELESGDQSVPGTTPEENIKTPDEMVERITTEDRSSSLREPEQLDSVFQELSSVDDHGSSSSSSASSTSSGADEQDGKLNEDAATCFDNEGDLQGHECDLQVHAGDLQGHVCNLEGQEGDVQGRTCLKDADRPSAARLAKRLFYLDGFRKSDVSPHLSKKSVKLCSLCVVFCPYIGRLAFSLTPV